MKELGLRHSNRIRRLNSLPPILLSV